MKHRIKTLPDLHYKLRMMYVPLSVPTYIHGCSMLESEKIRRKFYTEIPSQGCWYFILHFFLINRKQFSFFGRNLDLKNSKNTTFSPIRGSSVPGKPMQYWNTMALPVHSQAVVDYLDGLILRVVNYFDSLFHTECTGLLTPWFNWTNRIYCRNYYERNNTTTWFWDRFLYKMIRKVIIKRLRIIIVHEILGHVLEVLFHSYLGVFWVFTTYKSPQNLHVTCKKICICNIHLCMHTHHLI